eukprot:2916964-Lingulodinium_polyedra.AAC.1
MPSAWWLQPGCGIMRRSVAASRRARSSWAWSSVATSALPRPSACDARAWRRRPCTRRRLSGPRRRCCS